MTLREAIKKVLMEYGGVLTVEEISRRIKNKKLFVKSNGTPPEPSHVLFELKNRLDEFEAIIRLKK